MQRAIRNGSRGTQHDKEDVNPHCQHGIHHQREGERAHKVCNVTWGCFLRLEAVLYCCPKDPSCLPSVIQMDQAIWAMWAAIKKCRLIITTNMMLHCCKRCLDRWQVKVSINVKGWMEIYKVMYQWKRKLLDLKSKPSGNATSCKVITKKQTNVIFLWSATSLMPLVLYNGTYTYSLKRHTTTYIRCSTSVIMVVVSTHWALTSEIWQSVRTTTLRLWHFSFLTKVGWRIGGWGLWKGAWFFENIKLNLAFMCNLQELLLFVSEDLYIHRMINITCDFREKEREREKRERMQTPLPTIGSYYN